MVFVACGLNHKTAPLSVREQVTRVSSSGMPLAGHTENASELKEAVYLATCNRSELYCQSTNPEKVLDYFAQLHQLSPISIAPYLYLYQGEEAIAHALRVASGLDSMMLGEPQILGQLKKSFLDAEEAGCVGKELRRNFQFIFAAAKRIRHRSGINKNPISVASVAAQFIKKHSNNIADLSILIIGSGETSSLVAKYLYQAGAKHFFVASRTQENATKLAHTFNATPLSITNITEHLPKADVIISATACPMPFITQSMIKQALEQRGMKKMLLLDLAVPRDIEANVAELTQVHLLNVDDLHSQIEQGQKAREAAAHNAEQLLIQEIQNYTIHHRALQATAAICDYRAQMQTLANQELVRALQKLNHGAEAAQILEEFGQRLLNKLTHVPSIRLKQAATEGPKELHRLTQHLLNISEHNHPYEEIA